MSRFVTSFLLTYHYIANIFPRSFFGNFHRGVIYDCSTVPLRVPPALNPTNSPLTSPPPTDAHPLTQPSSCGQRWKAHGIPSAFLLRRRASSTPANSVSPSFSKPHISTILSPPVRVTLHPLTRSLSHSQSSPSRSPFSQELLLLSSSISKLALGNVCCNAQSGRGDNAS